MYFDVGELRFRFLIVEMILGSFLLYLVKSYLFEVKVGNLFLKRSRKRYRYIYIFVKKKLGCIYRN